MPQNCNAELMRPSAFLAERDSVCSNCATVEQIHAGQEECQLVGPFVRNPDFGATKVVQATEPRLAFLGRFHYVQ